MSKFDDLNDAFNVESEVVPEKTKEIQKVEEAASSMQDVKKDYEYTRGNLYSIIEKGQEALNGILEPFGLAFETCASIKRMKSDSFDFGHGHAFKSRASIECVVAN